MALDRQSIEKKDFPVGRRGYDPEAVDTHLSTLADEIADLKRSARRRTDTLASSASDQVRAIVEAAESSAAEIQRDAENEAREIRDEANSEAQATREQATDQAREYVGKVSESTDTMLKRVDAMESELGALIESLRTGGNRLSADLKLLEGNLAEVSGVVVPRPQFEPEEPEPEPAQEPEAVAEPQGAGFGEHGGESEGGGFGEHGGEPQGAGVGEPGGEPGGGFGEHGGEPQDAGFGEHGGESGPGSATQEAADAPPNGEAPAGESAGDAEGARLIALNMALNGTPRAETERYLSENFSLSDAGGLLDEVYASVEG